MVGAIWASIVVSLISLIGVVFLYGQKKYLMLYGGLMISMAAGVMLSAAILDLLPEAIELYDGKETYYSLLVGIAFFFLMERLIHWFHHHPHSEGHEHIGGCENCENEHVKPTAYLILMSDALHNFFDGVAIVAAFNINWELGIITTIAIILHEIPQELADFVALIHSGMQFKKALLYNLLSALTAILGVFVGGGFIRYFDNSLPFMLAFNSGMFIYIACSDLIPALHADFKKDKKWLQTFSFLGGILVMAVLTQTIDPHGLQHDKQQSVGGTTNTQVEGTIEIMKPQSESHLES